MSTPGDAPLSASAKRRARAKAAEAAKEEPAAAAPAAPAAAPKAKAKAAAEPKAKAAAEPKAKAKAAAEPKAAAQPAAAKAKAEPKASAKKQAAPKSQPAPAPKEEKADGGVAPVTIDDGTGGDWEVSIGVGKKLERAIKRKEEQKAELEKAKAASGASAYQTKSGVTQNIIPGMAPAQASSKPGVSQAVGATGVAAPAGAETAKVKAEPAFSSTIKVPEAKIGRVIGPKGANIKLITEKTGCTKIDTSGDVVTITGSPEAVSQAEHAIRELMDKGFMSMAFENFTEFPIMVHPSVFPDLIGKGGCVIKAIKEALKVEIEIPSVPKDPPAGKKYPVKVAGSAEAVDKGKQVVNDIVMYSHHEVTHPGMTHAELEIANWQYSYIIGKAGCELRHIQNNYKVKVNIPREHSANQNVLIVGEPSDVTRAQAYIEKVLWNAENESKGREKKDGSTEDPWGDDEHESWMDSYMYKRK